MVIFEAMWTISSKQEGVLVPPFLHYSMHFSGHVSHQHLASVFICHCSCYVVLKDTEMDGVKDDCVIFRCMFMWGGNCA